MFDRYTEPARRVIFYSRYMAHQAGSSVIETEHLLLGLLREDMVLAQRFLGSPWAAEQVCREVERRKPVRPMAPRTVDLPLSGASKRTLLLAAEEAERLSSKEIRTEHLLIGLLLNEECLAAELLHGRGLHLDSTREELNRSPHDDTKIGNFDRERSLFPQEMVELQTRIRSIVSHMKQALANHHFEAALSCSDEERMERDKLRSLHEKHGL